MILKKKSQYNMSEDADKKVPLELTAYGTTPSGKPRLFVCQVCTRAFARLEHLRRHERSHTKEKPFTCGVCQRKFSRRDLLLRHAQKLHAGCADAITRLRRKSVKKVEIRDGDDKSGVNFNVNVFGGSPAHPHTPQDPIHNQIQQMQQMHQRSSSHSAASFSPQKSRSDVLRNRATSFSAQSGLNYAVNIPEFNDLYPHTDNVEFSTPQVAPSQHYDEQSWLNNLSSIPGMNDDSDKFMMPTVTMQNDLKKEEVYGYSFYDIPDSIVNTFNTEFKLNNSLSTIKQEDELHEQEMHDHEMKEEHLKQEFEDHMKQEFGDHTSHEDTPIKLDHPEQFDFNFMNLENLTNEIVNGKFMPNGYSFYGDNASSTNNSPNYLTQNQIMNIESNYSRTTLFTNNIRNLITKALSQYPISGILNPILPPNEKLEFYLSVFKSDFLLHYPFIHESKLNEFEIMEMTASEAITNESSRSCLPLLVATIGALLSNNKNDSEHLYEASRRTIHIYLENRKLKSNKSNPLWLIHSLTLSVIYGLFSDNENNVFIVIRQLNALNSLVKTSIKEQVNFFINEGQDKFSKIINQQSQVRIVFIIYRLTTYLLIFYNIPLTLSINDLNNLEIPSKTEDMYWNCKNAEEFIELKSEEPEPKLVFKDLLLKITKSSNIGNLGVLHNLSKFGFSVLIDGIFEINQFNQNLNTINILDNLTSFLDVSEFDHEVNDYLILNNFIKISSIVDFKILKQQSWLKNYEELLKSYEKLTTTIKLNEFCKIDKVLDYTINCFNLLFYEFELFVVDKEEEEVRFKFRNQFRFNNLVFVQLIFHLIALTSILLLLYIRYPQLPYKQKLFLKFVVILQLFIELKDKLGLQLNYNIKLTEIKFNHISFLLNIGEILLNKIYTDNLNFIIFEKLSVNLFQIRRFLSNNEQKLIA